MSVFPSPDFATDIQPALRLWGLSPLELHDVYWKSRGVSVVRQGAREDFQDAEAFLLIDPHAMALFELRPAIRRLYWVDPMLLSIRLHGLVKNRMVEQDALYPGRTSSFRQGEIANRGNVTRVGLSKHRKIAQEWHESPNPTEAWRSFRREISQSRRAALSLPGVTGEAHFDEQAASIVGHIASIWQRPELFVDRALRIDSRIWKDTHTDIKVPTRGAFPIWLGIGRSTCHETAAHGPVILWDAPDATPAPSGADGAAATVNEVPQ